ASGAGSAPSSSRIGPCARFSWLSVYAAGLLDLRRAVELAVVVVVAVIRGDEAEVTVALQEVGAGLEDLLALGVARHADQGVLDRRHLVGRHLRVRHDAQVLVDLRSPQRPVFERFAAAVAR